MKGKWVAEQLLLRASNFVIPGREGLEPLRTMVVRVGQLCGSESGSWTRAEWFPSMMITGANLGMIPSSGEVVRVSPLDITVEG